MGFEFWSIKKVERLHFNTRTLWGMDFHFKKKGVIYGGLYKKRR